MQVTFDPTNPTEAAVVRRLLAEAPEPRAICDTFRAPELRLDPPPAAPAEEPPPPPPAEPDAEPEQSATPPDRDADGLPWDARIHAGTRALVADGTWRKRRGVDEAVVAQVEAELRALVAVQPPADPAEVFKPADAPPPPPPAPPAPVAPPPPPAAAAAGDPATFAELMVWLSPRLAAKSVTHEQVRAAAVDAGLASVENLLARPDLVGAVYRRLNP